MARRKPPKDAIRGLGHYAFLWVAPMFTILMAPIYLLHASSGDLSEATDDHMFVALGLILTIVSLSVLGCVLDETCACPRSSFPIVLFFIQMTLIFGAMVLDMALPQVAKAKLMSMPQKLSAGFLSHGPLLSGLALQSKPPAGLVPAATAVNGVSLVKEPVQEPVQQLAQPAGALAAVKTPQETAAELRLKEPLAPVAASGLRGWIDAGDGFCWDGETHEEFSSLHATGKTLQECADAGESDYQSIALDFAASNGACDIRYRAGALSKRIDGYQWWGWGAGGSHPTGCGKQKHDAKTHCYAKVIVATPAPPPPPPGTKILSSRIHPMLESLIREYPFQPVRNEANKLVNVILVRSPFRSREQEEMLDKYKNEILFIGISSFEDFPLSPPNPFSGHFAKDKYTGLFPGFLHMFRDTSCFPKETKLMLMSQSDFSIPGAQEPVPKKYDFALSGSDQDVYNDCVGWSSYAKNWSFVKEALEVMCGEFKMTGVLVATKSKDGKASCTIPASCKGLMTQTSYLDQNQFFDYVKQSRFLFVPQVHDASPRVTTQALAMNVPLLMNRNIIGGWKYVNEKTGEFFNDLSDIRTSLKKILQNTKTGGVYEPRRYVDDNLGDSISGDRLRRFVQENFQDRVKLPEPTSLLLPAGA